MIIEYRSGLRFHLDTLVEVHAWCDGCMEEGKAAVAVFGCIERGGVMWAAFSLN
jgi:hypothetical protein